MTKDQQMLKANADLQNAKRVADALLMEYQAALMRYDFQAAEIARVRAIDGFEAFIDQFAILYRLLSQG